MENELGYMNDELLEKIGKIIETKLEAERDQTRKVVREEVKAETEPMKKDIAILKDGQAHNTTALEALKAGQDDIREGIIRVEQKIDRVAKDIKSQKERIENLEEHTETPNPHKH